MASNPGLVQPFDLLFGRSTEVNLSQRERLLVTGPRVEQHLTVPADPVHTSSHCFDICVAMLFVAPMVLGGVEVQGRIEKPIARQVIVEPDDIGRRAHLAHQREL